jgi:L-serine deaminase
MNKTLGIHFGALSDPIADQLKNQNLKFDEKEVYQFQQDAEALTRLRIRGYIADSVVDKINQKLYNKIESHVCKINNLKKEKLK